MFNKNNRTALKLIIAIFLISQLSCASTIRSGARIGLGQAKPLLNDVMDSIMNFESAEVAKRGIPGLALMVSGIIEIRPNDPEIVSLAAMAYCAWGLMLDLEDPAFSSQLLKIGQGYALRALKLANSDLKKGIEDEGKHLSDFAKDLGSKEEIQAAWWYALNTGLYMFQNMENPYTLMNIADVTAVLEIVLKKDPTFFFHAPMIIEATMAAMGGPLLGYTPEKANAMFQKVFETTDKKNLLAYVMFVQFYAVTMVDEKLFDDTIEYILSVPNNALKGGQLINDVAKQRAIWLKNNKKKFF